MIHSVYLCIHLIKKIRFTTLIYNLYNYVINYCMYTNACKTAAKMTLIAVCIIGNVHNAINRSYHTIYKNYYVFKKVNKQV